MVIAIVSGESDARRGTVGATGGRGLLEVVGAKLLHVVNENFCSIPIDDTNCHYLDHLTSGASVA